MDFYDFFSGCGGTSRGMQAAGMEVRFGLDSDSDAKKTYISNFRKARFIHSDIRKVSVKDVIPYIQRRNGCPLVFGACAPCQPFSTQTKNRGAEDDRRSLLEEFHQFVEHFLPEYVFLENVPGLKQVGQGSTFEDFTEFLDGLGYLHDSGTVMVHNFGVPQTRRRLILMASLNGPIKLPKPTHGPGTDNPDLPTVWDWISDLPPIKAGETHLEDSNHRAARLSSLNLQRISSTPEGGSRLDWPEKFKLRCHKTHSGHTDVYGRMHKNRPAAALTTRCISLSNGRYGHPIQDRVISVREAACIQTFPSDFRFFGSLDSMARQVSNAVPVELSRICGLQMIEHFNTVQSIRSA